jgi:tetratricopeptide (TPR) repeat protein
MFGLARRLEPTFNRILMLLLALIATTAGTAQARTVDEALNDIEQRWAHAVFESTGRNKNKALASLLVDVRDFASDHSSNPEAVAWHGIVTHECIRNHCKSNASKLRLEARDALLKAESLGPGPLGGLVYGNLGGLYAQTSSTFGGFGSKVKGIGYMWKAIVLDPDGLDSNYLYAELLVDEGRYQEARDILLRASTMTVRSDHELADRGRREQALALLRQVESQLGLSS